MQEYDYDKDLEIDELALDYEWMVQPKLYMRYAEALADTEKEAQKAKEVLDFCRATLDSKIRGDAQTQGEKITEKVVESRIFMDEEYRSQQSVTLDKTHKISILKGAVKSFEHRKKALEKLVDLAIAGYYSAPKQRSGQQYDNLQNFRENNRKKLNNVQS